MQKKEMIKELASRWQVSQAVAAERYGVVLDVYKRELEEGGELRVGDLFKIEVRQMRAAMRYNIATKDVRMAAPRVSLKATLLRGLR